MLQQDYPTALAAYKEAKEIFQQLNEPTMIATAWHQTGIVYKRMQDYEQAEQAYRQSLAIESRQGNQAGEAGSLAELANLYDGWGKLEQALMFYRQAVDIYSRLGDKVGEGRQRSNIADSLIKLQRYDDARSECLQAITCKQAFGHSVQPWISWDILNRLEQACNNPTAAHAAKRQAIQSYIAYRRDGGENMSSRQLYQAVFLAIRENNSGPLQKELLDFQNSEDLPDYLKPVIPKLIAILQGERKPSLADDPELDYDDAAELLLLLERLDQALDSDV
jgi:tetratricopeptide (TPR) repeat protein